MYDIYNTYKYYGIAKLSHSLANKLHKIHIRHQQSPDISFFELPRENYSDGIFFRCAQRGTILIDSKAGRGRHIALPLLKDISQGRSAGHGDTNRSPPWRTNDNDGDIDKLVGRAWIYSVEFVSPSRPICHASPRTFLCVCVRVCVLE